MNGWTISPAINDHNRPALGSSDDRELCHGVTVEILIGGFRIPGIIEYRAKGDYVAFTIKKVRKSHVEYHPNCG